MIEVEVRGRLNPDEYRKAKEFFNSNGRHIESHEREMIILRDHAGYAAKPSERKIDIRLRNTNGKCEIMMKEMVGADMSSRNEISIALQDSTLDSARTLVRALGCAKGVLVHRKKEIYLYHDIEWSLVEVPKEIYHF